VLLEHGRIHPAGERVNERGDALKRSISSHALDLHQAIMPAAIDPLAARHPL
jgi:hypothetical protein